MVQSTVEGVQVLEYQIQSTIHKNLSRTQVLHGFGWEFVPLDYDLLSLELPNYFRYTGTLATAQASLKYKHTNIPKYKNSNKQTNQNTKIQRCKSHSEHLVRNGIHKQYFFENISLR